MTSKSTNSTSNKVHVISRNGGWAVKKEGNSRASKIYSTKDAAVKGARSLSKGSDIVVHKRDGSIATWHKSK